MKPWTMTYKQITMVSVPIKLYFPKYGDKLDLAQGLYFAGLWVKYLTIMEHWKVILILT